MIESFSSKSYWWVPTNPNNIVYGILNYSPIEGVKVDLIGILDEKDSNYEIIVGITESDQKITLYKSFEILRKINNPGFITSTVYANFALIGNDHFIISNNIKFQKATFYLKFFNEWLNNLEGFKQNYNEKEKHYSINYILPKAIETKIIKRFTIVFEPRFHVTGVNIADITSTEIIQNYSCSLLYYKKHSLTKIFSDIEHFQNFLTLCTQKPAFPLELHLINQNKQGQLRDKYQVLYRINTKLFNIKKSKPVDFLLKFKDIKSPFKLLITNWFKTKISLETCYIPYFNYYYGPESHTPDKFLNLCRAIEAFHRDTVGEIDASTGRVYHYKKRIVEIFEDVKLTFNHILKIRDKNKFAEKIKNIRNDLTHSNPISSSPLTAIRRNQNLEIHYLSERMLIILTCAILKHIGLSEKEIKKRIDNTSLYSHIKYKLK